MGIRQTRKNGIHDALNSLLIYCLTEILRRAFYSKHIHCIKSCVNLVSSYRLTQFIRIALLCFVSYYKSQKNA